MNAFYLWNRWGYLSAFVLVAFVPVSLWLFRRHKPTTAAVIVMLSGMMWLPESAGFDLPSVPPLEKFSITALAALLGAYARARGRVRAARFGRGLDAFVLILLAASFGTVLTNGDELTYGGWKRIHLPALKPYDALSMAIRDLLSVGLPFFLGRVFVRSAAELRELFYLMVLSGLIYAIPMLWEVRMSPMLHVNVYGFSPRREWAQNVRDGGFRPTVFMGHGLIVAFFNFLCFSAAVALARSGRHAIRGVPAFVVVLFLFAVQVLAKTGATLVYSIVAFLLLRYTRARTQLRVAMLLALVVVSYPFTRLFDIFPTDTLVSLSGKLSAERAESLQFRFDNEDILAIKAVERPWFGWGGFGRDRVYDPETAKDFVVQDGFWVVLFGTHGAVGFIAYYLTLLLPVVWAWRRLDTIPGRPERTLVAALGFMVMLCAVNTLPNMELNNLPFFLSGALAALMSELPKQAAPHDSKQQERHDEQRVV